MSRPFVEKTNISLITGSILLRWFDVQPNGYRCPVRTGPIVSRNSGLIDIAFARLFRTFHNTVHYASLDMSNMRPWSQLESQVKMLRPPPRSGQDAKPSGRLLLSLVWSNPQI